MSTLHRAGVKGRTVRFPRVFVAVALAAGAFVVIAPAVAGASDTAGGSLAFSATGAEQSFVVPAGATVMQVTAVGAPGGATIGQSGNNYAVGGYGAVVTTTIPAPAAGSTVYVEVGGLGNNGGFNGGGAGVSNAGGGGGATDLQTVASGQAGAAASQLLVAGGGGGAGYAGADVNELCYEYGCPPGAGGSAQPGNYTGGAGETGPDTQGTSLYGDAQDISGGQGGAGGTPSVGGIGGQAATPNSGCTGEGSDGGSSGGNGGRGSGGAGASTTACSLGAGGGGGGGYFGGGGGAGGNGEDTYASGGGGGGGAGSSFVESSALSSSVSVDTSGTPSLSITFNPTTVSVSCSPATDPVSVATSCTASVSNVGTNAVPTGTIAWTTSLSNGALSNSSCPLDDTGACSVTYTPLAGSSGAHTVTASYGGDSLHSASTGSGTETTAQLVTSSAANCAPTTDAVNESATCTVVVSNTGTGATLVPAGSMAWSIATGNGSLSSSSCTLAAGTCSVSYVPALGSEGAQSLDVVYAGDANHVGSSTDATLTASSRSSSVLAECNGSNVSVDASTTCTATVTDTGAGTPTPPAGSVTWSVATGSGSLSSSSCTLTGSSCSVTYTPALGSEGSQSLHAAYGGDVDHSASYGIASLNAVSRSSGVAVQCLQTNVVIAVGTTCTATVTDTDTGAATTPVGTVSWSVGLGNGAFGSSTCTLNGGACSVTYTPSAGSAGAQILDVTYNADANHGAATFDVDLTASQASQTASFTSSAPTSARMGGASYTVATSGGGSGEPVVVTSGSPQVCTVAGSTVSFVGHGTCVLDANESGNASYLASPEIQQSFSVEAPLVIVPPAAPAPAGAPATAFGVPTTVTSSSSSATTSSQSSGGTGSTLTIPAGALPLGTIVSVFPVTNDGSVLSLVPLDASYVTSVAVSWATPSSTAPNSVTPLSLVITDASIGVGDTVYEVTATGLVIVGVATVNGSAAVTFSSDPVFLITAPTLSQTPLQVTSLKGTVGSALTLEARGGSGTGAVTYVASDGTAKGCEIVGVSLTAKSAGTCLVDVTKAADAEYVAMTSSSAAVTFVAAIVIPKALMLKFTNGSTVMPSVTKRSALAFAKQLVRGNVVTIVANDKGDVEIETARVDKIVAYLRESFRGVVHVRLDAKSTASPNSVRLTAAKGSSAS